MAKKTLSYAFLKHVLIIPLPEYLSMITSAITRGEPSLNVFFYRVMRKNRSKFQNIALLLVILIRMPLKRVLFLKHFNFSVAITMIIVQGLLIKKIII